MIFQTQTLQETLAAICFREEEEFANIWMNEKDKTFVCNHAYIHSLFKI